MTEAEWLACDDPRPMLNFLRQREPGDDQRLRQFLGACCRARWHPTVHEPTRLALECAERFAATGPLPDSRKTYVDLPSGRAILECGAGQSLHALELATPGGVFQRVRLGSLDAALLWALETLGCGEPGLMTEHVRWGVGLLAQHGLSLARQAEVFRDLVRGPFRPLTFRAAWRTPTVRGVAQAIRDDEAFEQLPVLADALLDAGCTCEELLDHLRGSPGPHVRDCWALSLVLLYEG